MAVEGGLTILNGDQVGYRLLQELVAAQTFLCADVSENIVILKKLEEDCLHRGQLHPSIRDRLARVRELAHPRIATLRSVERWEGSACLVWIYLDGEPWDDSLGTSTIDLLKLCIGLAAAVDALHEIGIVHGSIHGRNVIERPDRQVWLTHVSPYLYTDPKADVVAMIELLRAAGGRLPGDVSARFAQLVNRLEAGEHSVREFSHLVLETINEPGETDSSPVVKDQGYRFSSLLAAAIIVVLSAAVWFAVHGKVAQPKPSAPTTFPSLRPNRS